MTKLDFSQINKSSAQSFHKQKNLIKKIGKGQTVLCSVCQKPLKLTVATDAETGIVCETGCTKIDLELES